MNQRTPVIARDLAIRIADFVAEQGYNHLHTHVYLIDGAWVGTIPDSVPWERRGEVYKTGKPVLEALDFSQFGELPPHWSVDVSDIFTERQTAKRQAVLRLEVQTFPTSPAIHAHLVALFTSNHRGLRAPQKVDLRSFAKAAQSTQDQWGKPRKAYQPEPGCTLTMRLSEAVSFEHTQESYADHSGYAIPVEGDLSKVDMEVCNRNLSTFFRYANTHTGMAGSGCNYSASLVVNDQGAFVYVHCRASIAD